MTEFSELQKKRAHKGAVKGVHPCPTCGVLYENATGKKKYCSRACYPPQRKTCLICSTAFFAKKKSELCCSATCKKQLNSNRIEEIKSKETGMIECLLCNTSHRQLASHLISKHRMSTADYINLYPGAQTISEQTAKKLSRRVSGEKNPWFNHGGKLSPFSIHNAKYKLLSKEEKEEKKLQAIFDYVKSTPKNQRPMNLEYWTSRGCSEEQAIIKRRQRQSTFSLEKCVERYGDTEGLDRWKNRQEKWMKSYKKSNYSKISQTLFKALLEKDDSLSDSIFANRFSDSRNDEITLALGNMVLKPDFYNPRLKAVIEFDGDYWHGQKNVQANPAREMQKDNSLKSAGVKVLHIREKDYIADKEGIVRKCLAFLNNQ